MKKALLFIFMFCFIGCGPSVKYNMKLTSIERPKNAKERYGKVNTTVIKDEQGQEKMVFEDNLIKALFVFGSESIIFEINNKTDFSIKVNWDNAVYVDTRGTSMRIIHSGVRLMDRNNPQAPSVIVRKGRLLDNVVPSDNIYFVSGQYGGWSYVPIFPAYDSATALTFKGKSCSLLLPLEIEGVTNDYIFTFNVDDVVVPKI